MASHARSPGPVELWKLRRRALLRGVFGAGAVAALGVRCAPAAATVPRKRSVAFLAPRSAGCPLPDEWRVTDGVAVRTKSTPLPSGCADAATPILEELGKRGYRDGENLAWTHASPAKLGEEGGNDVPAFAAPAAALVALGVEVIVAWGNGVMAAKQATTTIPIVMSGVGDVVESGIVSSLAHPGGNITGVSAQVVPLTIKRLELLKEAFPSVRRPLLIHGPSSAHMRAVGPAVEAGSQLGLSVVPIQYTGTHPDFIAKATQAVDDGVDSLTMVGRVGVRASAASLIRERRLPAVVSSIWIDDGAAAISLEQLDDYAAIANYVDRILRGAGPADLPIVPRSHWELVVNLKAATQLGLAVAPTVVVRATGVIR